MNITVDGNEMINHFGFREENYKEIDLVFSLVTNYTYKYLGYQGLLSFPYSYEDEKYSLIHQFYKKKIISKLAFSLIQENYENKLVIGESPLEYINNRVHSKLKPLGKNNRWDSIISEVSLINNTKRIVYDTKAFDGNNYMSFDLLNFMIYAPSEFIDILLDTFYKEYAYTEGCLIVKLNGKRQLNCHFDAHLQKGNISFIIGDYEYEIPLKKLWKCSYNLCFFQLMENPFGNGQNWVFGSIFLNLFNTEFNYEEKTINIYSSCKDLNIIKKKNKTYNNLWIIYLCIIIVGLTGIGLLIMIKNTFVFK